MKKYLLLMIPATVLAIVNSDVNEVHASSFSSFYNSHLQNKIDNLKLNTYFDDTLMITHYNFCPPMHLIMTFNDM